LADPNYIKRMQAIREKNVLSRTKGKPLLFRETQIIDLLIQNKVPTCMQHCCLKVMPKMIGTDHERFISAINICAAVFQKHGYMQLGSTTLTGKGMRNNTRHRLEVDAGRKSSTYKGIVERLWRGYMDRRVKDRQKSENVAPPDKKVLTGSEPKAPIQAPPSINVGQTKVISATNNSAKIIGPGTNVGRKPPFGTEE
jgi:hypothetical protein